MRCRPLPLFFLSLASGVPVFHVGICTRFDHGFDASHLAYGLAAEAFRQKSTLLRPATYDFAIQLHHRQTVLQNAVAVANDLVRPRPWSWNVTWIAAAVGCSDDYATESAAPIFMAAQVPMISAMAATESLASRARFPYFSRIVAMPRVFFHALRALARRFAWRRVFFLVPEWNVGQYLNLVEVVPDIIPVPMPALDRERNLDTSLFQHLASLDPRVMFLWSSSLYYVFPVLYELGILGDKLGAIVGPCIKSGEHVVGPSHGAYLQHAYPNDAIWQRTDWTLMQHLTRGYVGLCDASEVPRFDRAELDALWRSQTLSHVLATGDFRPRQFLRTTDEWFGDDLVNSRRYGSSFPRRFDAVTVVIYAIADLLKAGVPPTQVRGAALHEAMLAQNFEGLTGNVSFTEHAHAEVDLILMNQHPRLGAVEVGQFRTTGGLRLGSLHWLVAGSTPPADRARACPGGHTYNLSSRSCQGCEHGHFAQPPGDGEMAKMEGSSCQQCPVGFYADSSGLSHCRTCAAGSVATEPGTEKCPLCPVGKAQGLSGGTECVSCNSGRYASGTGSQECSECAVASFSTGGAAHCEACPPGRTTLLNGSVALSDCVCVMGTYDNDDESCEPCGTMQTTRADGARTLDECHFNALFYVTVLVPAVVVIFALFAIGVVRFFRRRVRIIEQEQRRNKIIECIEHTNDLAFPLVLMSAETFRSLGKLMPYEDAQDQHILCHLASMDKIREFLFEKHRKFVFFSHQWLAWTEPDPHNVHYKAIRDTMDATMAQMGWPVQSCYLWVDYHSVPQVTRQTQALAIKTLPIFASLASMFVVIAPDCVHADTKAACNFETYRKRMWCRAEAFSFYVRRGVQDMYRASEIGCKDGSVGLSNIEDGTIDDTILVFEGNCTCCVRNHHNMDHCDKETLRDVFLGLYADVYQLHAARVSPQCSNPTLRQLQAEEVMKRIEKQKDRIFPERFEATFENMEVSTTLTLASVFSVGPQKSETRERRILFGELINTLEGMFQADMGEGADVCGPMLSSAQESNPDVVHAII
mmetsp:Transcript_44199/g.127889  ORF Transcript_44199/g.127889 Transcript_44199/m.127889 type:complete len:1037 (-) Transcript_44199:121-3231(-)